jgi:hypothetical protein
MNQIVMYLHQAKAGMCCPLPEQTGQGVHAEQQSCGTHSNSLVTVAVAAMMTSRRPTKEHVPKEVLEVAKAGAAVGCGRK